MDILQPTGQYNQVILVWNEPNLKNDNFKSLMNTFIKERLEMTLTPCFKDLNKLKVLVSNVSSTHCIPTLNYGTPCGVLNSELYLENCNWQIIRYLIIKT